MGEFFTCQIDELKTCPKVDSSRWQHPNRMQFQGQSRWGHKEIALKTINAGDCVLKLTFNLRVLRIKLNSPLKQRFQHLVIGNKGLELVEKDASLPGLLQ